MVARAQVLAQALKLSAEERVSLIAELAATLLGSAPDQDLVAAQEALERAPRLDRLEEAWPPPLTLRESLRKELAREKERAPLALEQPINQFHAVEPGAQESLCGRVRARRRDARTGRWPDNAYRFGYTAETLMDAKSSYLACPECLNRIRSQSDDKATG